MRIQYGQSYMRAGIYRIRCSANNTVYVGQAKNLSRRTATHRQQLRKGAHYNPHMQSAYNKYGEESFSVAYLLHCDVEDLTWYEQRVLDIYRRHCAVFNSAAPVDTPMLGVTRQYNENCINALHTNRHLAHEALARKRETDADYVNFMSGVGRKSLARLRSDPVIEAKRKRLAAEAHGSVELKKLRSAQIRARFANGWTPKRNPNTVQIIDTNTGTIYKSYTAAAEALGVGSPTIHRWVNGRKDGRSKNTNGKPNWRVYDKENL